MWFKQSISIIIILIFDLHLINSCQYKYPDKHDPSKIRLCVSSRWVPWLNKTIGMVDANTTIFCNPFSLVHNYFTLVNLSIPSYNGIVETEIIERKCDLVISVTNGVYFHETYNRSTILLPYILTYPSSNSEILLIWSNKMRWKQWMIENGFGKYVAKAIDLFTPTYPFILKEGLSENSEGVTVIQNSIELQSKLNYFKDNNISHYYGEEPLTGMNNSQGIFYVSAFRGKVMNIQCYVYLILKDDIQKQNYNNSLFIAGKPNNTHHVKGHIFRVKNDVEIAFALRRITKRGMYSGVFCAEFKMNRLQQIIFLEFNARICFKLTQKDEYFVEAYLPLAFSLHRHIRNIKPSNYRLYNIKKNSRLWYQNNSLQSKTRDYHLHSNNSIENHYSLPSIAQLLNRSHLYR